MQAEESVLLVFTPVRCILVVYKYFDIAAFGTSTVLRLQLLHFCVLFAIAFQNQSQTKPNQLRNATRSLQHYYFTHPFSTTVFASNLQKSTIRKTKSSSVKPIAR